MARRCRSTGTFRRSDHKPVRLAVDCDRRDQDPHRDDFLAQAGGGDVMRLVSIAATECGIIIAAPVHDAFWILAPLDELDTTIARMTRIMIEAGKLVTGGLPIRVKVAAVVRWPQCLGDVRKPDAKGQAMWCEVRDLVRNGGLQKVSHG